MKSSFFFRIQRSLIIITLYLSIFVPLKSQEYASETWKFIADLDNIGRANIISHDIDTDSIGELIYSSSGAGSVIKFLDFKDGIYKEIYTSPLFTEQITGMEIYDLDGDGNFNLYISWGKKEIGVFDFNTRKIIDTISLPGYAKKFFLIDTENNGSFEVVAYNDSGVFLADLNGNLLFEKLIHGIRDIEVGNVDNDSDNEVVVSAFNSHVLNLKNFEIKWLFYGSFGIDIELKDINNAGYDLIFGEEYGSLKCFNAQLKSPLWEMHTGSMGSKIALLDIDHNNDFELLVGTVEKNKGLKCYNPKNQDLIWEMDLVSGGVTDFSYEDPDGDGSFELTYGCGTVSSEDVLVIIDINTQTTEYKSLDYSEGFTFDIGEINEDGVMDYFITSLSSYSEYGDGIGYVYDGLTKEIISDKINLSSPISDISMIYYNNTHYILISYSATFAIYNYEKGSTILEVSTLPNFIYGSGFYVPKNGGNPQVFVCLERGLVKFFDFINDTCIESWSTYSTNNYPMDYQIGNFDNDPNDEIAYQSGGLLNIYDISTHLLNGQIELQNCSYCAFEITDLDQNGELEVLYGDNYGDLVIKNMVTLSESKIDALEDFNNITTENLDSDNLPEIIVLTDNRLIIYKSDGTVLFKTGVINADSYYNCKTIKAGDFDEDKHKEILVSTYYGVWEYKISQEYADILPPVIKKLIPFEGTNTVALNSELKIFFSEIIDVDSIDTKINISDQSGNNFKSTFSLIEDKKLLLIRPENILPANQKITVTLSNKIKDLAGNVLDGNKNGIPDGESDNHIWSFFTGSGIDTIGPQINEMKYSDRVFKGSLIEFSGIASDSSEIASSEIEYIECFIDNFPGFGQGKQIKADDKYFDEIAEEFSFKLNTSGLSFGQHTIYFVAKDALGNWGSPAAFIIEIINESSTNWTKFDFDYFNTGSNPYSDLNFPLKIKHSFEYLDQGVDCMVSKSLLIENYLVYSTNKSSGWHRLICQDIVSGDIIWQKDFNIPSNISTATYANGNIYVQLENNEKKKLACFDLITGEEKWSKEYSVQWPTENGPVVYEDKVYIIEGFYATILSAYNSSTGKMIWQRELNENHYNQWLPAFYNDTLYAYVGKLFALNPNNGGIYYKLDESYIPYQWSGYSMKASPIVDTINNQLIITSSYYIHAFSLVDRKLNWTIPLENGIIASPALYEDKLYFMSAFKAIEINSSDGIMTWSTDVEFNNWYGFHTVANEYLVAFSDSEKTYLFDRKSHELQMTIEKGGAMILGNDYLIHSSLYGQLKVFEHSTTPVPLFGSLKIVKAIDCFGNSTGSIEAIVFGGTKPYIFNWSNTDTIKTSALNNLKAGTYYVTVTDQSLDTLILSIEITEPTEMILSGYQEPALPGTNYGTAIVNALGGTSPYTYVWDYDPSYNSPVLSWIPADNYGVKVIDTNGCEKYIVITVETKVGTEETDFSNKVSVFPTVTKDEVFIAADQSIKKLSIAIFNSIGQMVEQRSYENLTNQIISLGIFAEGVYFMKLTDGNNYMIKKIILSR